MSSLDFKVWIQRDSDGNRVEKRFDFQLVESAVYSHQNYRQYDATVLAFENVFKNVSQNEACNMYQVPDVSSNFQSNHFYWLYDLDFLLLTFFRSRPSRLAFTKTSRFACLITAARCSASLRFCIQDTMVVNTR